MSTYWVNLPTYPTLSPSAQKRMLARAQAGDAHAREEFIKANTKLAVKFAQKYYTLDPEDAFQFALMGLAKAMDTFDPERGFAFSTYAARCMNNELGKEITKALSQGRGEGAVAASLDRALASSASVTGTDDGKTLAEHLGVDDPDLKGVEDADFARAMLRRVSGRHLEVIERLYGLNGRDPQTLTEVSEEWGVSRQRIDQLHKQGLARIRGEL